MTKILVADDEADFEVLIRQKFRQKIREQEYEFVFAVNGNGTLENGPCFNKINQSFHCVKVNEVLLKNKEKAVTIYNVLD